MNIDQAERASIAALESEVRLFVECGKFGDALDAIRQFVESVIVNQRSVGKVFVSADIDRLCGYVGEVAANKAKVKSCSTENIGTVILATEVVMAGGHAELIKDFIRLKLFDEPINVLLTDLFGSADHDMIANFSATCGVTVDVARGGSTNERLMSVLNHLWGLAPTTLVLLTHNHDSLGISVAHSHVADKVVFIHHGDHHLCLGVTCEDFLHVDPHNIGFFHCKDELGVKNNYYWPLTVNCDSLQPRSNSFLAEGKLVTCSSGRPEKFDASYYLYDYFKLIPKLLAATSGRHIHIGSLTADMKDKLQQGLMAARVDPERFTNIPWVPSIASALIENNVDLYISSFPLGGGKASLEAMAAGIPLLMHQSYRSRFHGGVDLAYPEAWLWRTEAELIDIVKNITGDDLIRHSLLARVHYDKFHSDQSLIDASDFSKSQDIDAVPKLRQYSADNLQIFLDETAEFNATHPATREFHSQLIERDLQINAYRVQAEQFDIQLRATNTQIDNLNQVIQQRDGQITNLNQALTFRDHEMTALRNSTSWQLTKPLRALSSLLKEGHKGTQSVNTVRTKKYVALLKRVYHRFYLGLGKLPKDFNRDVYLKLNPDLAAAEIDLAAHFLLYGCREGRIFSLPTMDFCGDQDFTPDRETILVVSHEASRTGAPVLSLNLVQALVGRYNVVALLLGGGSLSDAFRQAGAKVMTASDLRGNPERADLVVGQLCELFNFKFALVNSIESRVVLPGLAEKFVPTISLLHEFAAYTRPKDAFKDAFFWSGEVVFSANVTLENALAEYPDLVSRSTHILPQGRCLLTFGESSEAQLHVESTQIRLLIRPKDIAKDSVIVLGAGFVQLRKGVDLFIECAALVLRAQGGDRCRFVWIGKGYDPENDIGYSVYLADQIRRAGLQNHVFFIDETVAIETAYEEADLFFLSSRLDPLPNVAIDAMAHGVPVLCFNKTTGIADFLIESGLQNHCVAEYLDSTGMAEKILALAGSQDLRKDVANQCREASSAYFNMKAYVARLEDLTRNAWNRTQQEKADTKEILDSGLFQRDFSSPSHRQCQTIEEAVRFFVRAWASGINRRKPCPGFHPGIYLEQHGVAEHGVDPFADYIRAKRPDGPWNYSVIVAGEIVEKDLPDSQRVALHLHVYYPELLSEITTRLLGNRIHPDLFISIPNEQARDLVVTELKNYKGKVVDIQLVPNRGRDIGPFLTLFGQRILANYDFVGHMHTKKTADVKDSAMGKMWYRFLLENLLGNESNSMVDSILVKMKNDTSIGMVFPDDPYIEGWGNNLAFAKPFAERMGLEKLPEHFVFPVGSMFWARASILAPLMDLNLGWDDYSEEPLPYDGSELHAIERLFSLALSVNNSHCATTNVNGLTR